MDNTESLELVQSSITDCETEIEKLDQLTASAAMSEETITKLENDISGLHSNTTNLEQKTRASRLTGATSLLTLERGDLTTFKAQIDAQSNRVVQFAQRAKMMLQQIHAALLQSRKSGIEAMLEATFDLRFLRPHAPAFASAAFCVQEVKEFEGTLFQYRFLPRDLDIAIDDARKLRERSTALLTMAANECPALAIVNVQLGLIAGPKPVVAGNTLGVLAASAAA